MDIDVGAMIAVDSDDGAGMSFDTGAKRAANKTMPHLDGGFRSQLSVPKRSNFQKEIVAIFNHYFEV